LEYAAPCVPGGRLDVLIVKADDPAEAGPIDRVTVAVAVLSSRLTGELESVTFTLKEELPLEVGVPEMVPPSARLSPAGSLPPLMLQV
jgi:hypothetical protein